MLLLPDVEGVLLLPVAGHALATGDVHSPVCIGRVACPCTDWIWAFSTLNRLHGSPPWQEIGQAAVVHGNLGN